MVCCLFIASTGISDIPGIPKDGDDKPGSGIH